MGVNEESTIITSTGRTAAVNSDLQTNKDHRGAQFIFYGATSASAGSPIVLLVQGKDVTTGNYYNLFISGSINAGGWQVFNIYPGLSTGASALNGLLPRNYRVRVEQANSGSAATYSVSQVQIV